ncbi:MAG: hypothetical protein EBQ75_07145 [Actinobacteria bacterium]|nr:hypothetical protein [Actinomycetota bacterium]
MDTSVGSAGSTSASRQTWMSGGAVDGACRVVRERLFEHVGRVHGIDPIRLSISGTDVVDELAGFRISVADATEGIELSHTYEHHHRKTEDLTKTDRAIAMSRSRSLHTGQSSTWTSSSVSSRSSRLQPLRMWARSSIHSQYSDKSKVESRKVSDLRSWKKSSSITEL